LPQHTLISPEPAELLLLHSQFVPWEAASDGRLGPARQCSRDSYVRYPSYSGHQKARPRKACQWPSSAKREVAALGSHLPVAGLQIATRAMIVTRLPGWAGCKCSVQQYEDSIGTSHAADSAMERCTRVARVQGCKAAERQAASAKIDSAWASLLFLPLGYESSTEVPGILGGSRKDPPVSCVAKCLPVPRCLLVPAPADHSALLRGGKGFDGLSQSCNKRAITPGSMLVWAITRSYAGRGPGLDTAATGPGPL
jgi:hypothetical protein